MLQFNKENLRKVFHDFYVLTHLRIVLIDSEFNELLSYPETQQGFCAEIRRNMDVHSKCLASDKAGCLACANSKELNIYRCHMGLVEAVIPILDGGEILGYVMFGQILKSDTCDMERRRLKRTFANWPYRSIDSVVDEIPTRSEEELNAAATILQALTTYVLFNRWVAPKKYYFSQLKFLYPLKTLAFPAFSPLRFGPFPSFFPLREEMRETFFRPSLQPYPAALRKFAWPLWWRGRKCSSWYLHQNVPTAPAHPWVLPRGKEGLSYMYASTDGSENHPYPRSSFGSIGTHC